MQFLISGIQQVGVGVDNVMEAWDWYRKNLGFDIPVVNAPGTAEKMLKYTGNKPQERHAIIAINLQGGGGLEIWQYLTRTPQHASFEIQAGDLGIFATKIKTNKIHEVFHDFKEKQIKLLSNIEIDPKGNKHFFFEDPYGNVFQMVDEKSVFVETDAL